MSMTIHISGYSIAALAMLTLFLVLTISIAAQEICRGLRSVQYALLAIEQNVEDLADQKRFEYDDGYLTARLRKFIPVRKP